MMYECDDRLTTDYGDKLFIVPRKLSFLKMDYRIQCWMGNDVLFKFLAAVIFASISLHSSWPCCRALSSAASSRDATKQFGCRRLWCNGFSAMSG
jgi:hypothetical protein